MKSLKVTFALLVLAAACFPFRRYRPSGGEAGHFDFYLFVLSWSPEFCYSHPTATECSQDRGFVVHGLWPQNSDGSYPSSCATSQTPPVHTESVSEIMPLTLIKHEWEVHGTCSGLTGDQYLALIERAYSSIKIPAQFQAPHASFAITPAKLKQEFRAANPSLSESSIAIQLRGRYLDSVKCCLSKDQALTPIACPSVRDARGTFLVPPVR
jgi:ribonuclease T2